MFSVCLDTLWILCNNPALDSSEIRAARQHRPANTGRAELAGTDPFLHHTFQVASVVLNAMLQL